jgi:hypothetical protein
MTAFLHHDLQLQQVLSHSIDYHQIGPLPADWQGHPASSPVWFCSNF